MAIKMMIRSMRGASSSQMFSYGYRPQQAMSRVGQLQSRSLALITLNRFNSCT